MSMHTYIGARYVPRFVGVYNNTQIYEALDVVDNGSGTSYIARKTVPAGTPLTDTEYWFVYGASSGAIIQLQNDMIQAQNDINNITLVEIPALQNQIYAKNRNILIIGNSYVNYDVCDPLAELFDNSYEFTSGGVGFNTYTGHSDTFETCLDNAIAAASPDNNKITDIIFVSAMGDTRAYDENRSTYKSRLSTALAALQTKIAANFPNCHRVCVTFAESRNQVAFSDSKWDALFGVHRMFREVCQLYGMDYIGWSGFNSLMVASQFQGDNYHPNSSGAAVIGEFIKASYFGKVEYMTKYSTAACPFKYVNTTDSATGVCALTPDTTNIQIRQATLSAGSVTLAAGDDLIKFDNMACPPPAPIVAIDSGDHLEALRNGTELDYFEIEINADSSGRARVQNLRAPQQATCSGFLAGIRFLTNFTYFN